MDGVVDHNTVVHAQTNDSLVKSGQLRLGESDPTRVAQDPQGVPRPDLEHYRILVAN